jgi:ElaB/YqjD/DUF883 family membrane-anchored ribosome-binding protein
MGNQTEGAKAQAHKMQGKMEEKLDRAGEKIKDTAKEMQDKLEQTARRAKERFDEQRGK